MLTPRDLGSLRAGCGGRSAPVGAYAACAGLVGAYAPHVQCRPTAHVRHEHAPLLSPFTRDVGSVGVCDHTQGNVRA